mgnify:CR=1 FL=1
MSVISMKQLLEAGVQFLDIRQEDGILRWLRISTQKEMVSISSTCRSL